MASPAPKGPTFTDLARQIAQGKALAPVYILHGEEGYYTDRLLALFGQTVPEADRDFNLQTFYAPETPMAAVHEACRRFPMMADRQTVIVKEMQAITAAEADRIAAYVRHPSPTTLLVLAFRGENAKGKELMAAAKESGAVVFEAAKLKEGAVAGELTRLLKERGLNIEPKSAELMREHTGTDLSLIYREVEKLATALAPGATVTPEVIEQLIGISKDYNHYELTEAILRRDSLRALQIVKRFEANENAHPVPQIISTVFGSFADLTVCHFSRDRSPAAVAKALGRSEWAAKRVLGNMGAYNARQCIEIIGIIRRADCHFKGIGSRMDGYAILRRMILEIFAAQGRMPY